MATQTATAPRTHNSYTVGWVCALSKEQTAATAMLDQMHPDLCKSPKDYNTYTLGSIGEHNIVIACLPKGKYGTISAATVATWMVSTFPSIKVGLMVGIGGGIPPMVRLGDVVVSAPVDQYPGVVQWDMGKAEKDGNFKRTGALNNPPSALLTALTRLETKHDMCGSKIPQYLDDLGKKWPNLVPKYTRSDSLQDPFLTPDDSQRAQSKWQAIFSLLWVKILFLLGYFLGQRVLVPLDSGADQATSRVANVKIDRTQRKSGDMRVHYGLIASGNQVIKDHEFRDNLNRSLGGHVLCAEMEAAGLMNDFPCIVIRGICDYADSQKNKDWQEHAAAVAAAYAKELLEHVQPSDIDRERPVKDILDQVLSTVSKTEADVRVVKSKLDRKEDLEILNWLTLQSIDYGPQHSDFLKRREPGTCQWLLDSVEYQDWLKGDKQTLFCPGIPGAGKTILTSVVVHDLTVRFSEDQGVGIAYIYCNFQRQGEQSVDNLLLSLLKQLSESHSSLPESVKSLYNHHKTKQTRPSLDETSTVLQSVAAVYSRIFLIVDALDECQVSDGCRARFMSELSNFQSRYGANIFATSRFIPDVINFFKPSIPLEVRASQKDVARYLEGHIGQLPSFVHQNRELQEEIIKGISEAVDGMFLLAQIYLGLLDDKLTLNDIRGALEVFRKQGQGLDEDQKVRVLAQAYEQAIERIKGQKLGLKNLAMKVLSWITCAKRPLTTLELQHALATKAGKSELDQGDLPHIDDMVSVCSGLVTVDEESNIIRLVHYTTQEYFKETQRDWFPDTEAEITKICVTYLSFSVFDSGFCLTDDEFEERLQSNKLYNYAAQNWGHHASKALTSCVEVVHFLNYKAKVEGSSQALLAIKRYSSHSGYSQEFPKQITGLHLAAYFGVEEAAKAVLQERVGADGKNTYGQTPLLWAAKNGHEAVVKLLLEKGAKLESKDNGSGQTPLSWAAKNGREAVVKLLLEKGAELESKDNGSGQTPLLWAARYGREVVVKLLLEKGAELESKDSNYGQTPLSWAARYGREVVVKLLLEKGAELESKDSNYGQTPLSWAARYGREAVVKLLLEKGAELESKDSNYGQTPLSWAARYGREAVVKLLLEKGAELESKDSDYGQTPLLWAAENGHEAVVKLLLEKGAELESKDSNYGQTPLLWAAENGHEAVVKLLLEKGAELESKDSNYGQTPLLWAAKNGREAVVKLLLEKGAELESKDNGSGQTPLLWAAENGHEAVVKLLLEKGAELESKDSYYGQTPLSWAAKNGHEAVVELLLEKGASMKGTFM